jgi:hypothetical protein
MTPNDIRIEFSDRENDSRNIFFRDARLKKFLSVDNWQSACVQAGFTLLRIYLKDPTGVSQELKAYRSLDIPGYLWIWKQKTILKKLQKLLSEAKNVYQSKKLFCLYIEQVNQAAKDEMQRLCIGLYNDLLINKNNPDSASFLYFLEYKEFSRESLDFLLDVVAARARNKKQSDKKERFAEFDRIMDKYSIRETESNLNTTSKLRAEWAKAWSDGDEQKCEVILNAICGDMRTNVLENFGRYWQSHA